MLAHPRPQRVIHAIGVEGLALGKFESGFFTGAEIGAGAEVGQPGELLLAPAMAARELGVRSPLLEAGLTKQDIRDLSRRMGLSTWDKPSYACLSSISVSKPTSSTSSATRIGSKRFRTFRMSHVTPTA